MEERIKSLFRKYLTNTCTKEEFEEVFLYLENAGNASLMREQLRQIYGEELKVLPSEVTVGANGALTGMQEEPEARRGTEVAAVRKKRKNTFSIAAVILVLAVFGTWWIVRPIRQGRTAGKELAAGRVIRQATQRSEYKYLLLPDSTQVWLNAASTLEFPESFGKGERKVVLTGEAFFDVSHAERSPFIIYTGKVSTEVLGTAFNIKAYTGLEKITVIVRRGKVKVSYANKAVALLTMGQQVSIFDKDSTVKQKKLVSAETSSWQDGNLVYDDYSIGDIIADLERVYNVRILVENPTIHNLRVSTAFRRSDGVKKALEVIGQLTDTELLTENGQYIMK